MIKFFYSPFLLLLFFSVTKASQDGLPVKSNSLYSIKTDYPLIFSAVDKRRIDKTEIKLDKIFLNNYNLISYNNIDTTIIEKLPQQIVEKIHKDSFLLKGKKITGIASFYSANLDGSITATGERYRNNGLTAASNNFKLNTWVLVTNLKNNNKVVVRINDRMHDRMKKKGRVVDLSRLAARQLDFMANGLVKVKVETIVLISSSDSILKSPEKIRSDSLPVKKALLENDFNGVTDFELNAWVRKTNLKNNKSIILRINDRMPRKMQQKGRVVTISKIAANRLDCIKNGLARVKVGGWQRNFGIKWV